MLTDKTRNRYDAQNECVAKSGALASVRSEEEWIFIKGWCKLNCKSIKP